MTMRWASLIASPDGEVDYVRVFKFISAIGGVAGIAILVIAGFVSVFKLVAVPTEQVLIVGGSLVMPITGGQIAHGISGKLASSRIQSGQQAGRRTSDTQEHPSDTEVK